MAGRYRGTRQLPPKEKVPWYRQVGRFAARRGYDLLNAMVPGTVFDYREGTGDINPRRAFGNSTVAESARYLRGRPEGMSDEEWARIQREGKEGLFDTAWDFLPIPKIPVVSSAVRRGVRNTLLGPNSRSGPGATVVPTVSGAGVTTTEAPVQVPGGRRKPIPGAQISGSAPSAGLPADWVSPTFTNRSDAQNYLNMLYGNQSGRSSVGIAQGGTRGFGVNSLSGADIGNFLAGIGDVNFGPTPMSRLAPLDPRLAEYYDRWSTRTGEPVFQRRNAAAATGGDNGDIREKVW